MKQADYAISIENLSEDYHVKFIYPDRSVERRIRALDKINFTVTRGESVAILGPNGAGKTTLLKIIAGMLKPDYGHIAVNGKVRGIFALESGFIPDLTGYQNLKMAFKLYDINDAVLDQIVEFSELGDFIYAPLKSYSQGMYLRLAFSIAINTAPDILIIDDILAVGDYYFQRKCIAKIKELIAQGKTMLIVTHNFDLAELLCQRCIVMEKGKIFAQGNIPHMKTVFSEIAGNLWGSGCIKNNNISIVFNNGKTILRYKDNPITVELGCFISFKKNGKVLYSTDLKWQITESEGRLCAYGTIAGEEICKLEIELCENEIKYSLHSSFPETEMNYMLLDSFYALKQRDSIVQLPEVEKETAREWKKVFESESRQLILLPQNDTGYPEISFMVYSDDSARIELFNHYFNTAMRITRITTKKSHINTRMIFAETNCKSDKEYGLKRNSVVSELCESINQSLKKFNKIDFSLVNKINFTTSFQEEAFEDFECEILDYQGIFDVQMVINFFRISVSLMCKIKVDESGAHFHFSSFTPGAAKHINSIGFIISPEAKYQYFSAGLTEGVISKQTGSLSAKQVRLSSVNKAVPDLIIELLSDTNLEIVKDKYAPESTNIKFLPRLREGDFDVSFKL